jgi:hypothetical protein
MVAGFTSVYEISAYYHNFSLLVLFWTMARSTNDVYEFLYRDSACQHDTEKNMAAIGNCCF